jgi:hypothetical protein
MQERQSQRWRKQGWKGAPFRSLNSDGLDFVALCVASHLIEQDRLAPTA